MCPNGVEFKTLGEVCIVKTAPMKLDKKEYQEEGLYPIVDQGQKYIVGYTDNAKALIPADDYVIFGDHTREIKYVDFTFAQGADGVKILKTKNEILPRFLYHVLKNTQIPSRGYNRHWTIAKDIEIPLPPIEIQKKIVECLDKFSALAAELQAELQLRRKQYEYYRTQLLTPHSDCNSADNTDDAQWEWKYLVDVATVQYGYPFEAEKFTDDESYIPLIRIRDVMPAQASTYYEGTYPPEYIVKKGDILVGMDGNFNLEKWNDRDGLLNQRVCKISTKDNNIILNDYLYHYLRPEFKKIENEIKGGTVKHLSAARIKQIMIPVPPINEQCKIAEALNLFTKIIQDMEEGIPAEQIRQQKRYEYFRDLLLAFDRKAV